MCQKVAEGIVDRATTPSVWQLILSAPKSCSRILITCIGLVAFGASGTQALGLDNSLTAEVDVKEIRHKENGANAQAIFDAAYSAGESKDWLRSIELYRAYLDMKPDDAMGHRNLAWTLHQINRTDEAAVILHKAALLAPNNARSWSSLCQIELERNRPKQARPACARAHELEPGSFTNAVSLGHTWMLVGQRKAARYWYEKAVLLIDSVEDLGEDEESDFGRFITKGWQPQLAREMRAWFVRKGEAWLERKAPADQLLRDSKVAEEEGDDLQAISILKLRLAMLRRLYGTLHPRLVQATRSLYEKCERYGRQRYDAARFSEAIPAFRCTANILENERGKRHPELSFSLNALAGLYSSNGQYAEAIPLYKRTLAIRENAFGPEHRTVAETLNDLALTYQSLGQFALALPLYQRALAIYERNEHSSLWIAKSLNNISSLYQAKGQASEAIPLVERALAIYESAPSIGPAHANTATTVSNLASLHFSLGQYELAEPLLIRALAISEKYHGAHHPNTGIALNNMAMLYGAMNQPQRAQAVIDRAYRIALNAGSPELLHSVQGNLSDLYAKQSRPEAAIFFGKQAVNTLQGLRANVANLGKDTLKSFDDMVEGIYRNLSRLLIAEGRLVEAERVLELLKEQEQFQFVRRDASASPLSGRAPLTQLEAAQDQRLALAGAPLAKLYAELVTLEDLPTRSAEQDARLKTVRQQLDAADAAFQDSFETVLATLNNAQRQDRGEALKEAQGLQDTLRTLNEQTGEQVVALYTVADAEQYALILTTADYRRAYTVPLKRGELNEKIAAFRRSVQNRGHDPRREGLALLDVVLPPAARAELAQAKATTLMWHLDGALRLLPLAALHDGKNYLIEHYRLVTFTAASLTNLKDTPKPKWNGLGLGVSEKREVSGKPFSALPAVAEELRTIIRTEGNQGVIPGNRYLNADFNWQNLEASLKRKGRYPLVHIASHFHLEPGNDTTSYLLSGDDELITLAKLKSQNNLFGGVDLLTLSACETAVGGSKDATGKEVDGLSFIAQRQGAKAVLATLWPVADEGTARLMERFYRLREEQTLTKAEALRQAQLALLGTKFGAGGTASDAERGAVRRNDGSTAAAFTPAPAAPFAHPYYWAPFILMGNWL